MRPAASGCTPRAIARAIGMGRRRTRTPTSDDREDRVQTSDQLGRKAGRIRTVAPKVGCACFANSWVHLDHFDDQTVRWPSGAAGRRRPRRPRAVRPAIAQGDRRALALAIAARVAPRLDPAGERDRDDDARQRRELTRAAVVIGVAIPHSASAAKPGSLASTRPSWFASSSASATKPVVAVAPPDISCRCRTARRRNQSCSRRCDRARSDGVAAVGQSVAVGAPAWNANVPPRVNSTAWPSNATTSGVLSPHSAATDGPPRRLTRDRCSVAARGSARRSTPRRTRTSFFGSPGCHALARA